jgi:hypothetical protein
MDRQEFTKIAGDKEGSFITFVNFAAFCSNDFLGFRLYTLCFLRLLLFKVFYGYSFCGSLRLCARLHRYAKHAV